MRMVESMAISLPFITDGMERQANGEERPTFRGRDDLALLVDGSAPWFYGP